MQSSPCSTLAPTIKVNEDRYGITRTGIFVSVSPNSSPEERRIQGIKPLTNLSLMMRDALGNYLLHHFCLHDGVESLKYLLDVEMQRQAYERYRRDRDKRIESRREAERVISMKTKAVKYSHLKNMRVSFKSVSPSKTSRNSNITDDDQNAQLHYSHWIPEQCRVASQLNKMGKGVLERIRYYSSLYANKEITAQTWYFRVLPLLEECEPETKYKLLKELVDMHTPDNKGIENGKQCLYDYVDYMEDSACGSSSEGMEPLDLNVTNKYGDTPLIIAAQKGSTLCIAVLVSLSETDIARQNSAGCTALIIATMLDHKEVIRMLLESHTMVGASVQYQNIKGFTALHWSCINNNAWATRALATMITGNDEGSGMNLRTRWEHDWRLPVHKCAEYGSTEALLALIEEGVMTKSYDVGILKVLMEYGGCSILTKSESRQIPMQWAIQANALDSVKFLANHKLREQQRMCTQMERQCLQQLLVEADKLPDVNHHHLKTHQHNEDQLGHEDGSNEFNRRWLHRFTEFICCGDTTADDNGERFTVL